MTELIYKLVSILGKGEANALQAKAISLKLGIYSFSSTQEKTRALIRTAIIDHDVPIGSSTKGYFLISSREELEQVVDQLITRSDGILERVAQLRMNYYG